MTGNDIAHVVQTTEGNYHYPYLKNGQVVTIRVKDWTMERVVTQPLRRGRPEQGDGAKPVPERDRRK